MVEERRILCQYGSILWMKWRVFCNKQNLQISVYSFMEKYISLVCLKFQFSIRCLFSTTLVLLCRCLLYLYKYTSDISLISIAFQYLLHMFHVCYMAVTCVLIFDFIFLLSHTSNNNNNDLILSLHSSFQ